MSHRVPLVAFSFSLSILSAGCLSSLEPGGAGMKGGPDLAAEEEEHILVDDGPSVPPPDMAEPPPADLAGPASTTGTLSVAVSAASQSQRLNESKELTVTITPAGGFSGVVTLSVEGLPTGATATFDPPGGMITGALNAKLTIKTSSNMAAASNLPLKVKALSGTISGEQALAFSVVQELLVSIAPGVVFNALNTSAFGATSFPVPYVAPGTKITFINNDGIDHRIHAGNQNGFNHEPDNLLKDAGNSYSVTVTATGTYNFNCHIHSNMRGQIVVQ